MREVVFLRPVINERRLDERSLLLSKQGSGTAAGCSFKGCVSAIGASLSSLASVERIKINYFNFSQENSG